MHRAPIAQGHGGGLQGQAQAFGRSHRFGQRGAGHEHGKLFAADARGQVDAAQLGHQQLRQLHQHIVAPGVAVFVVDLLEKVHVQHQHTEHLHAAAAARDFVFGLVVEVAPVAQAGQRVAARHALQLGLHTLLLGVVEHRGAAGHKAALGIVDGGGADQDGHGRAGGGQQLHLQVLDVPFLHELGKAVLEYLLAGRCQEVGIGPALHQCQRQAQPLQLGLVHAQHAAFLVERVVAAGCVVVQILHLLACVHGHVAVTAHGRLAALGGIKLLGNGRKL